MALFIVRHLLVLGVVFSFNLYAAEHNDQLHPRVLYRLWEAIKKPFVGPAEAMGGYSAGCLVGAEPLPPSGVGFQVMRPVRERHYGHPLMIAFLKEHARTNKQAAGTDLLIGDVSRPGGGPTISGHVSHQTGLDVDIWYLQAKKKLSRKARNQINSPNLVSGDRVRNWKSAYSRVIKKIAEDPRVDRIFVHAAIKNRLCGENKKLSAQWLAKVRPWWGHADHFHVRLRCPDGNSRCQAQEPLDPGHAGCGPELAWWFSQEAKDELAKRQSTLQSEDRPFPALPKECEQLTSLAAGSE